MTNIVKAPVGFTSVDGSVYLVDPEGDGSGTGGWTVSLTSADPVISAYTDVIDVLPYNGDGRGTAFSGSYTVTDVTADTGATVYYTDADPATISTDPSDASNGAPNAPSAIWSTAKPAKVTAVRVIGGALAPTEVTSFRINIATTGSQPGDQFVNVGAGIAEHTQLMRRTSGTLVFPSNYALNVEKQIQDRDGVWQDADDAAFYPTYYLGSNDRNLWTSSAG